MELDGLLRSLQALNFSCRVDGANAKRSNALTSLATHSKRYEMGMGKAKSHVSIADRSQV